MKKTICGFFVLFLMCFSSAAIAQSFDWKKELKRDLVTISGSDMNYSELEICTAKGTPKAFQVRWNAKAPKRGVVSRDQFVAITTAVQSMFATKVAEAMNVSLTDYLQKISCKPVEEAIGMVDLEMTIVMSKGGMQIRAAQPATKKSNQSTVTWAQIFEK